MLWDPRHDQQTTTAEPWRKLLLKVAAHVEARGLQQGGGDCPLRLIWRYANGDVSAEYAAVQNMERFLRCRVDAWCDTHTQAEVTAAMRACAAQ